MVNSSTPSDSGASIMVTGTIKRSVVLVKTNTVCSSMKSWPGGINKRRRGSYLFELTMMRLDTKEQGRLIMAVSGGNHCCITVGPSIQWTLWDQLILPTIGFKICPKGCPNMEFVWYAVSTIIRCSTVTVVQSFIQLRCNSVSAFSQASWPTVWLLNFWPSCSFRISC